MNSSLPIVEIWAKREDQPLGEWCLRISDIFANSQMSLITTSRILGVHPAELFAVLNLATMDEKVLKQISDVNPPKTTWLSLSKADEEGVAAALNSLALSKQNKVLLSPCKIVDDAIESVGGGGPTTRVAKLSSESIVHAAKKAELYNALNPKSRQALKRFGTMRKTGKLLTPKQIGYMQGMLEELADRGVIKRDSLDGDVEICVQILDALGRP